VDGIIVQSVHPTKDYARWLTGLPVPVVAIGNRISPNVPFVGIDDRGAAYEATRHLHGRGYDRFVIVCPPLRHLGSENIDAQEQRYLGFLDFIHSRTNDGSEPAVIQTKDLSQAVTIARANSPARTAFFCTSDIFALGVLDTLRDSGLRIPEDVGVMGFDNIDTLRYVRPRLATVDQEVEDISKAAVDQLVALMNKESVPAQCECPYEIVPGETA
jgi:LacI family transcriptional regulator